MSLKYEPASVRQHISGNRELAERNRCGVCINPSQVSRCLRLKDLLGPVRRVKTKKKTKKMRCLYQPVAGGAAVRGTSLVSNCLLPGPYSWTMPRALW